MACKHGVLRQTRSLSVFFIRCGRLGPNGLQAALSYFKFLPHLPSGRAPGLLWHQCGPDFFGPMSICFLNYLSPDVVPIQPNLTLLYYFLPLISNLFGDIVIFWVLTLLPNLEASVICLNQRLPHSRLLMMTLTNNISIRDGALYLKPLTLLTDCLTYYISAYFQTTFFSRTI